MQGAIAHLFAGVPVSDLDAGIDWYTRFFGRPPDRRVGDEVLWEIDEHAWLFIEPIEAYSNGVRHVNVPDPDGNAIAFAEPPDAGSASPPWCSYRSLGRGTIPPAVRSSSRGIRPASSSPAASRSA
jgi:hypothetical protein